MLKKYAYPISVLAIFSAIFWTFPAYLDVSEWMQNSLLATRDVFFKIRRFSSEPPGEIKQIVLVGVDEESCERLGLRWPWPRETFAALITRLKEDGARIVGLNFSFTGFESGGDASSRRLGEAIQAHGNVVVGASFDHADHLIRPNSAIADSVRYGYLEKIVDPDFSMRRSYLVRPYLDEHGAEAIEDVTTRESRFESSFPLELLSADMDPGRRARARFNSDLGLVTLGNPTMGVYIETDGSWLINYLANESDFAQISAWKVLQRKVSPDKIKDKVALVGLVDPLFGDHHRTPMGMLPGTAIHANEFLSLLSQRGLRFLPDGFVFFLSWLMGLCVLGLFLFRRFWLGLFGFAVAFVGLFLAVEAVFLQDYVIEPFIFLLGPSWAALVGLFAHSFRLIVENRGLETKAINDNLTGLYKYEYLRECLEEEWKRCVRGKLPVSLVMTDLDRFKQINDTLGHETGNDVIKRAADLIKETTRRYDIASRYGGDEFVILLWHTNGEEARAYRERLRTLYHKMARSFDEPLLKDSSISIGVACFNPAKDAKHPASPQKLIEEADKDLFADKLRKN